MATHDHHKDAAHHHELAAKHRLQLMNIMLQVITKNQLIMHTWLMDISKKLNITLLRQLNIILNRDIEIIDR